MLGLLTSLICLIFAATYIYFKRRQRYWKNLGIVGPEPTMVFGNMKDFINLKCTEPAMMHEWYLKYRNEPYIGYFNFMKPSLYVIDPELVKAITEEDFNHFTDHPELCTSSGNDAVLDSLFTMTGARWKAKRQIFTKLFSPMKLRELTTIMEKHNDILIREVEEQLKLTEEIDLMVLNERHILKTITSFLYSLDSSQNKETHSKLSELSEFFARPPSHVVMRFLFFTIWPDIYKTLRLSAFSSVFWNYFSDFANQLLYSRKVTQVERDDMITLIAKLQTEGSEKIDYPEAVGHLFTFLIAGHHTTMTTISHVLYQLSLHPEVQQKLKNEIDSVLKGKGITYEALKQMTYLEAVINETLRLFPLLGVLKRTCTKPYKVNDKFTIPKGMDVTLPAYSIHTDASYYPEPEKFLPERFADSEKLPALFMPFGKGPRTCIGMRFAYIAMKAVISKMVSDYEILPGKNAEIPVKMDPRTFFITVHPAGGLHVRLQRRQ